LLKLVILAKYKKFAQNLLGFHLQVISGHYKKRETTGFCLACLIYNIITNQKNRHRRLTNTDIKKEVFPHSKKRDLILKDYLQLGTIFSARHRNK